MPETPEFKEKSDYFKSTSQFVLRIPNSDL